MSPMTAVGAFIFEKASYATKQY